MLVRPNSDGTYSATWTPASIGWYSILTTIDGYAAHEVSLSLVGFISAVK